MTNKPSGAAKYTSVEEYHQAFPEEIRTILDEMKNLILEAATEAEFTISYNIPTAKWKGTLVHYAALNKHIGLYPTPEAIEFFKKDLEAYKTSKGAIQFLIGQKLPKALIKRIVKHRVQLNGNS
ncbi:MAG: DUF1801 domain-containing protein [Saprospiraceae bacterium]|nr:DUF1801 domain-containing protein [Saprospiraceae bacterium]